MASYDGIDRIKDQSGVAALDVSQTVRRTSDMPVDSVEVFESLEDAKAYARGDNTGNAYQSGACAYVGQKVTIIDKELSSADVYMVTDGSGTLLRFADQADIDDLTESIFDNKTRIDAQNVAIGRWVAERTAELTSVAMPDAPATVWTHVSSAVAGGQLLRINCAFRCGDSDGVVAVFGTSGRIDKSMTVNPCCGRFFKTDGNQLSSVGSVTLNVFGGDYSGQCSSYVATDVYSSEDTTAGNFLYNNGSGIQQLGGYFMAVAYHNSNWYASNDLGHVFKADNDDFSSWTEIFMTKGVSEMKSIGDSLYLCEQEGGIWKSTSDGGFVKLQSLNDIVAKYSAYYKYEYYLDIDTIGNTIVVSTSRGIFYSDNGGTDWAKAEIIGASKNYGFWGLASSGTRVVARASFVTAGTGHCVFYSDNGKVFYEGTTQLISANDVPSYLFYFDGIWYAGSNKKTPYISYDGILWKYDASVISDLRGATCAVKLKNKTLLGINTTDDNSNPQGYKQSEIERKKAAVYTDLSVTGEIKPGLAALPTGGAVYDAMAQLSATLVEMLRNR